jgi:hypothetical protein
MVRGGLFTRYFLEDGVRELAAYRALDAADVAAFRDFVRAQWWTIEGMPHPNEEETREEFSDHVIERLGWQSLPQQEPGRGRRDIADALLFIDSETKAKASRLRSADRFRLGAIVVEHEARDTRLDRAGSGGETPATQLLRYLGRAETESDGACRWGLLTNGRFWRLYWNRARARAEGFVEFELPALIGDMPPSARQGADDLHWLRVFILLFRRDALIPEGVAGQTFLDLALAEGRRYEQRVTATLSSIVFDQVFPKLVTALGGSISVPRPQDEAWRAAIRECALIILYRLLFLFYAEDRDLLPVRNEAYLNYALRALRIDAAKIIDEKRTVSESRTVWWGRLRELFGAIANGDASMGLPPYNGGLFDDSRVPLLRDVALSDATLAGLIDAMSREEIAGIRRWINYRDLSVQHLGAIYERLLEREVVAAEDGSLSLRPSIFARKTTGSYYTPDELVQLIIRRAVGPLLEERREAFRIKAEALARERRPKADRLADLRRDDLASAFVALRVCDPAMGSGHFLVSLVDYLTDEALIAISEAAALASWADAGHPYRSPLAARIEELRRHIRGAADEHGWFVSDDQLDDRHLIRRIILKRVVYGVDLNPMAVELAKLSLWLHSFTMGAPLSFLDHHLRCGDSLFGEFVGPVEREMQERYKLMVNQAVIRARQSAAGMARIEDLTDSDIGEVADSKRTFASVEEATGGLRAFLDFVQAGRWITPEDDAALQARELLMGGSYGDPVGLAQGEPLKAAKGDGVSVRKRGAKIDPAKVREAATSFVDQARALASERRFLHWETAFPGVWSDWESSEPPGGFDAVIGNPPWDRMKLQEVEWFAARVPEIAHAQRAADRKRMIAGLHKRRDPVAAQYDRAAWIAETATRVARDGESYPLLSSGDINVYSLFVERGMRLVKKDGIVGLIVPSGIAADKGAAEFFRSVSTTGRLAALLDFENRRTALSLEPFFPDVDSRFKFCAFVAGGAARHFAKADCAFFQQDPEAAERAAFALAPEDFAAVNPNTGTAPVFRSQRDAEITLGIYRRLPVLVDRRDSEPKPAWPLRYVRMFDMTNDSDKFRTAAELEKLGAYRVAGQRWEKGNKRWLPLYEGKMVQAYDHRAASVVVHTQNLNRPAQPEPATDAQHQDRRWSPDPQFWVEASQIDLPPGLSAVLGFKEISSPTNVRTVIATLAPAVAFGNKVPLLLPQVHNADEAPQGLGRAVNSYERWAPLLLANLNSIALDFIARQKLHGQTLNLFIVEQLPVIPEDDFRRKFGRKTADAIIHDDVLRLTYVSDDMEPFARSQGYDGKPFPWDEEDRLKRRARLDALFFHLYGLDREAADYILGTFPIVRREEEERYGRFRSRDLILAYMSAFAAGSPDADIEG